MDVGSIELLSYNTALYDCMYPFARTIADVVIISIYVHLLVVTLHSNLIRACEVVIIIKIPVAYLKFE